MYWLVEDYVVQIYNKMLYFSERTLGPSGIVEYGVSSLMNIRWNVLGVS
jgi:hypothetical protein